LPNRYLYFCLAFVGKKTNKSKVLQTLNYSEKATAVLFNFQILLYLFMFIKYLIFRQFLFLYKKF